jgi:hypothetical protein
MLVSPPIAEIGERPVAYVSGGEPAVALDRFSAARVIGANDARESSGSSLADNAVGPTKSPNMIVSRCSAAATVTSRGVLARVNFTSKAIGQQGWHAFLKSW